MQCRKGISKDDFYIVSHDDDRTNRITYKINANTIGMKVTIDDSNRFFKLGFVDEQQYYQHSNTPL